MNAINLKIDEIAEILLYQINEGSYSRRLGGLGLYGGEGGIVLFLAHYLEYNRGHRNAAMIANYLEEYLDKLCEGEFNHTFASGVSGILSAIRLLARENMLDVDYTELESGYEQYMLKKMNQDFEAGNYDFLHGALGVAFCYCQNRKFIDSVVKYMEDTAIKKGNVYKWVSNLGRDQSVGYNIALSHGMSSVVLILAQMYLSSYKQDILKKLIKGAVNYILSQEMDYRQYGSFFPSHSLENATSYAVGKSRLAWCYGDLGIAVALWQCGNILTIPEWTEKALEIFAFSTSRKNPSDTMVWDACVCHGCAGNAMIYKYIY